MASQLKLRDGRIIDYHLTGARDGFPLLFAHGNPGAWVPVPHVVKACEDHRFTYISWSRPGFGGSTRKKDRSVVDFADDAKELLKHLGHDKFAVMGWSAGGPHSLACAARLEGCVAAVIVAGLAPYDGEGLTWAPDTSKDMAKEGEGALQKRYQARREGMITATAKQIVEGEKPGPDKTALEEIPGLAQYVEDTFREAMKNNVDGLVDDDVAFFKPWGFDVKDIRVPVFLYHGTADPSVPFNHAQWIASQISPELVTAHFEEGGGHVSVIKDADAILKEVKRVIQT